MQKNVLLGVTASIAAYKACEVVRSLRKKDINVRCVLSRDAGRFITPVTLQALSGQKVHTDMFALAEEPRVEHISLSDEAGCILIAPATADIIARLASGMCDDLLSATVCAAATKKPVIMASAMNQDMYENPITQDNISYLKEKGYHFIEGVEGDLACGREGKGHIAPVEQIVSETVRILEGR